MTAAVVELDALADPVRPTAENDDLVARGWSRLVAVLAAEAQLVSRVHVGGRRSELRRTGVDALEDGMDTKLLAMLCEFTFARRSELGEAPVGESHRLQTPEIYCILRQPAFADLVLHEDDLLDLADEPRVVFARGMDLLDSRSEPQGLRDLEDAVGGGRGERRADGVLVVTFAQPRDRDLV